MFFGCFDLSESDPGLVFPQKTLLRALQGWMTLIVHDCMSSCHSNGVWEFPTHQQAFTGIDRTKSLLKAFYSRRVSDPNDVISKITIRNHPSRPDAYQPF